MRTTQRSPARRAGGLFICGIAALRLVAGEDLPDSLRLLRGPINGAVLERGGHRLVVYGDPAGELTGADQVLFTHARRDVAWAGRRLVEQGARAVVPAREAGSFTNVATFWRNWRQARFHDYAQQSSELPTRSLPVAQTVSDGEVLEWRDLSIEVLDTPGYTRGAVSYLVELDGRTVAFTGDLIVGDGRLPDLYSLQDAIPEAGIRGYHGWAARLAEVVASLQRLAAERPTLLVPVRGPVITDPEAAIQRSLERIRAVYTNYLSIDALRWYFGDDHILTKARRVLGPGAGVDWMPMAVEVREKLPAWITAINNTRLVRANDGTGLLIDCGSQGILKQLLQLHDEGRLRSIELLFITHYHDDHTDAVPDLLREFHPTVLACPEMVDVLERPGTFRLPAMTDHPIPISACVRDGAHWRWKEFQLTLWWFPGQTRFHQALLVQKDGGESVCFIGDSFTPSGVDDYCLQNRNLLHPDLGYFRCLDLLEQLPTGCLLINQHVKPAFRFSAEQIARMRATLKQRRDLLAQLSPWEDPNFALDAGWARFRPYAATTTPGATLHGGLVVFNHAPETRRCRIRFHPPAGWQVVSPAPAAILIPPRQEGVFHFRLRAPKRRSADPLPAVLTADVTLGGQTMPRWCEMLLETGNAPAPSPAP